MEGGRARRICAPMFLHARGAADRAFWIEGEDAQFRLDVLAAHDAYRHDERQFPTPCCIAYVQIVFPLLADAVQRCLIGFAQQLLDLEVQRQMISSAYSLQKWRWWRINGWYFRADLRQLRHGDNAAVDNLERGEAALPGAAASDIQVHVLAFLKVHAAHVGAVAWVGCAVTGGETVVELICLLYTSPSPRDRTRSRMPSSA